MSLYVHWKTLGFGLPQVLGQGEAAMCFEALLQATGCPRWNDDQLPRSGGVNLPIFWDKLLYWYHWCRTEKIELLIVYPIHIPMIFPFHPSIAGDRSAIALTCWSATPSILPWRCCHRCAQRIPADRRLLHPGGNDIGDWYTMIHIIILL